MRNKRFTFVYSDHEKQLLEKLAAQLQRSKSDTVRYLIREKAESLGFAGGEEVDAQNQ